jgi:hypothetical protein
MFVGSNARAQYEAPIELAQRFNVPLIDLEYGVDWYYVTINGEKVEVLQDHTCLAGNRWCSDPILSCKYVAGICSYCHSAAVAPAPGTPSGPLVAADGFCVPVPPSWDDDCYVFKKLDCGFRYESTCAGGSCSAVPAGTANLGACEPRSCTPP